MARARQSVTMLKFNCEEKEAGKAAAAVKREGLFEPAGRVTRSHVEIDLSFSC